MEKQCQWVGMLEGAAGLGTSSVASKIWLDPLGNAPERTKWAKKCSGALKIGKKVLRSTQNGPKNAPEQGAAPAAAPEHQM